MTPQQPQAAPDRIDHGRSESARVAPDCRISLVQRLWEAEGSDAPWLDHILNRDPFRQDRA